MCPCWTTSRGTQVSVTIQPENWAHFSSDPVYFEMSFSKLFVWNMTQYETVLWLDSDTLVVQSLNKVFSKADALLSPKDSRAGPRLGMVHDCEYYFHHANTGLWPAPGSPGDYANSGVILLKPGHYWAIKSLLSLLVCYRPKRVSLHAEPKEWRPYQAKQKPAGRPGLHQRALSLGEAWPWAAAQHYCAFTAGRKKILLNSFEFHFRFFILGSNLLWIYKESQHCHLSFCRKKTWISVWDNKESVVSLQYLRQIY